MFFFSNGTSISSSDFELFLEFFERGCVNSLSDNVTSDSLLVSELLLLEIFVDVSLEEPIINI